MRKRLALFFVMALIAASVLSRRAIRDARWRGAFESRGASVVLRPLSLWRTREVLRELTRGDPLVVTVGSISRNDDGTSVHLVLHNRGGCVVRSFRAVAYGFDAMAEPAAITASGGQHITVQGSGLAVEPGGEQEFQQSTVASPSASLCAAHVDAVECADGSRWTRGALGASVR